MTPAASPYDILSLSQHSSPSASEIKQAYRRALLQHHPDKALAVSKKGKGTPSVDAIISAYRTLTTHDTQNGGIRLLPSVKTDTEVEEDAEAVRATLSEIIDLSVMKYHNGIIDDPDEVYDENGYDGGDELAEEGPYFSHTCHRCGMQQGFSLALSDLEACEGYQTNSSHPSKGGDDGGTQAKARGEERLVVLACEGCSLTLGVEYCVL